MTTHRTLAAALAILPLLTLGACQDDPVPGEPIAPEGNGFNIRIDAQSGTQHGTESMDFDDAASITFTEVQADGTLVNLVEVDVGANQTATARFDLPSTAEMVLVEAWTADGDLVAAAISEETGRSEEIPRNVLLDAETTTEAWVWTDRVARSGDPYASNLVMVRTLIDSRLAAVVYEEYAEGLSTDEEIAALSDATLAAQAATDAGYANAAVTTSPEDRYLDTVEASQALTDALYTESSTNLAAWTTFYQSLDLAAERAGMTDDERVDTASATSLAFRASLERRSDLSITFADHADRSGAMWEAWNVHHVLVELDDSTVGPADDFWFDARTSASSDELLTAWSRLSTDLALSLPNSSNLPSDIDDYVNDVVNGDIDGLLGGTLDQAVDALAVAFETNEAVGADGELAAAFWDDVRLSVTTIIDEETSYGPADNELAVEMLVHASAAHRVMY